MIESVRDTYIAEFLHRQGVTSAVDWLAADASFRRYGRVRHQEESLIVMDAPPGMPTRTKEFFDIAQLLHGHGIAVPRVLSAELEHGVLLLQDFGVELFSAILEQDSSQAEVLYDLAYECIAALQTRIVERPHAGHDFDCHVMRQELRLFRDWYCPAAGIVLSDQAWAAFDDLVHHHQDIIAGLPHRFVLRDCHVDNFLYRRAKDGLARCGVLDFQDGGWGSALYDVTSLLFDVRYDVPLQIQQRLLRQHADFLNLAWDVYRPAAVYLVLQRTLKVLGIFVRLNVRDGKGQYLQHLARCWDQVSDICAELPDWWHWFQDYFPADQRGGSNMHPVYPVDTAMLLAAGQGCRMGALGKATPKPLLNVAGTSIITRGQQQFRKAGVKRFVINAHHRADQVVAHFATLPDSQVIAETERLETGGGIRHALSAIGRELFWIMNGDSLWNAVDPQSLGQLIFIFHKTIQNIDCKSYHACASAMLLLIPLHNWQGKDGRADFCFVDVSPGVICRATPETPSGDGLGYAGVMLMHRAAIAAERVECFSLNRIFDQLIAGKRLYGVAVDWQFYHVGTPEALEQADGVFLRNNGQADHG